MSSGIGEFHGISEDVASLATQVRVRVLNCSATGCLLETSEAVSVGSYGRLRVSFGGRVFDDTIHVVRCEYLSGTGSIHHVAATFVSTTPPYADSLRYSMRRGSTDLPGWLDREEER